MTTKWNEPVHEIMTLFVLRKLILQTRTRSYPVGLDVWRFGWTLRLLQYYMCAKSEGSGETARMRRLAWAFAVRLCDKYHNLMNWLKLRWFLTNQHALTKRQTDTRRREKKKKKKTTQVQPVCVLFALDFIFWLFIRICNIVAITVFSFFVFHFDTYFTLNGHASYKLTNDKSKKELDKGILKVFILINNQIAWAPFYNKWSSSMQDALI